MGFGSSMEGCPKLMLKVLLVGDPKPTHEPYVKVVGFHRIYIYSMTIIVQDFRNLILGEVLVLAPSTLGRS